MIVTTLSVSVLLLTRILAATGPGVSRGLLPWIGAAAWLGISLGAVQCGDERSSGLWTAAAILGVGQAAVHLALDRVMADAVSQKGTDAHARRVGDVLAGSQPCTIVLALYLVFGGVIGSLAVMSKGATSFCAAVPLLDIHTMWALGTAISLVPASGAKKAVSIAVMSTLGVLALSFVLIVTAASCNA